MNSKPIYFILGIISTFILAPCLAWVLTLGVSEFEGGRGFAWLYLTPVLFIGLLILWFIDYKIFYKPNNNFLKYRNIFFSVVILTTFIVFTIDNYIQTKEKTKRTQNRPKCIAAVKDYYEGYIIDTVYKSLKIRKIDSAYTEFKYGHFKTNEFHSYFYRGQKISKKANETEFEVELKDGTLKRFKIPCYE